MWTLGAALLGATGAFVFLVLRHELSCPTSVATMLSVPSVLVGGLIVASLTVALPVTMLEASAALGVLVVLLNGSYVLAKADRTP